MSDESVRTDQWLWAARFFRTRPLAANALKNGRVTINGQRGKPSRRLAPGDLVAIEKTPWQRYEVRVVTLAKRRLGAEIAAGLYRETEAGRTARLEMAATGKLARRLVTFPAARPDRRARRKLRDLRRQRDHQGNRCPHPMT